MVLLNDNSEDRYAFLSINYKVLNSFLKSHVHEVDVCMKLMCRYIFEYKRNIVFSFHLNHLTDPCFASRAGSFFCIETVMHR